MDLFLIVEPSNGHVEMDDAPKMYRIGEIVPAAMPELKGVMPVLYSVEHPQKQRPVLERIARRDCERGLAPRICALIATGVEAPELLKHLGDMIAVPRETNGYSAFRFYDPRVFPNLHWILSPEQLACLYGPIETWSYFADDGWRASPQSTAFPTQGLTLSPSQRATLRRMHVIEQALQSIQQAGESLEPRIRQKLDTLLATGADYGLKGEDLMVFAVQGALVSPYIARHPAVAQALEPDQKQSYAEITSRWTDENWARIAQELSQSH